jgi:hypothetical protein
MVVSRGVRWCAALGVLGLTVGTWAHAGVRGGTQLASKVHDYYAECRNPDTELCTVQSPDVDFHAELTRRGCGINLGLVMPRSRGPCGTQQGSVPLTRS